MIIWFNPAGGNIFAAVKKNSCKHWPHWKLCVNFVTESRSTALISFTMDTWLRKIAFLSFRLALWLTSGTEIVSKIVTDGIPCLLILDIGQNIMDLINMICIEVMYLQTLPNKGDSVYDVWVGSFNDVSGLLCYCTSSFKSTNFTFILPFI